MWGLNTEKLKNEFDKKYLKYFLSKTENLVNDNFLKKSGNNFILTEKGIFISDNIIESFFIT